MLLLTGVSLCLAGNPRATGFLPMVKPDRPAAAASLPEAASSFDAGAATSASTLTLGPGETLLSALTRAGLSAAEARREVALLKGQIDPRRLRTGDQLTLSFVGEGGRRTLASVVWNNVREGNMSVAFLPGAVRPGKPTGQPAGAKPTTQSAGAAMVVKTMAVHGSSALPRVLAESGLPPQVCEQVTMALSQARRPPVHGEMVKIVYQMPADPASGAAPQLRYAAYGGRDGKQYMFHYTALAVPAALQQVDLTPAVAVNLSQPLPGARISSPFGWRIHPVFHTQKFHRGVDYAAALGTPVIATADGVIEDIGRRGSYGKYIRIRHSDRLETAYAHLSRFAAKLAIGKQIHRGDVIGYVGMTGVATGPHLYYELLVDGRQIDPESTALRVALQPHMATPPHLPQTANMQ